MTESNDLNIAVLADTNLKKSFEKKGAKGNHKFILELEEDKNKISVANNTSAVDYKFKIAPINLNYNWAEWGTKIKYTVNINGVKVASGYIPKYDGKSTVVLASGTVNVEHTIDGSKTIAVSFNVEDNANMYYTCGNAKIDDGSMELTKIARGAVITYATDFNDESVADVSYNNPAGNNVDTLALGINIDDQLKISYRNVEKNISGSYRFNFTNEELAILRNSTTTSNSRKVQFILKTVIGDNTFYSTIQKDFYIINANPVFNVDQVSYEDTNTSVVNITKNNQMIVQNKSSLKINYTNATALKGANISKYIFTLNGVEKQGTNNSAFFGNINISSNATLNVKVVDSRGNSTSFSKTITIVPYSAPTANVSLYRLNNYEDESYLNVDASISSINNKNTMTIKYRYKLLKDSFNDFVVINDNVKQTFSLNKNNEYIFNIVVIDAFNEKFDKDFMLPKGVFPMFIDVAKNSVGINGFPVNNNSFEIFGNMYINGNLLSYYLHPIGSIYASENATDPQTLFGGTWKNITDKYLYAAGTKHSAGSSFGSDKIKLSADNLPSFDIPSAELKGNFGEVFSGANDKTSGIVTRKNNSDKQYTNYNTDTNKWSEYAINASHGHKFVGKNTEIDNTPSGYAFYVWVRTG